MAYLGNRVSTATVVDTKIVAAKADSFEEMVAGVEETIEV